MRLASLANERTESPDLEPSAAKDASKSAILKRKATVANANAYLAAAAPRGFPDSGGRRQRTTTATVRVERRFVLKKPLGFRPRNDLSLGLYQPRFHSPDPWRKNKPLPGSPRSWLADRRTRPLGG